MLKIALIGCGRIAKRHAELLGLGQVPGARLVSVCDIRSERAAGFGSQFNVPHYTDFRAMMTEIRPDVAVVLTESGAHADHVTELAGFGRHIVVEKPMALTLDDADRMIRACSQNGVKLFVVKQNRFNLPILKLRNAITSGRFGKLVLGTVRVRWCRTQEYYNNDSWRGTWAMDGGVLANQASHHIDMLEWMMGDVESVYALSSTALVKIETEDTAVVALRFKSGALGVIEATTATRPRDLEGSISILGANGVVEIGGFALNQLKTWKFTETFADDHDVEARFSVNPPNVYGYGHLAYYNHVVKCITGGAEQIIDGAQGRRSLDIITAIYESIDTGLPVSLSGRRAGCRLGRIG